MARKDTLSADGDTAEVAVQGNTLLAATGTWGSGTITIKYKPEGETDWVSVAEETYTADFEKIATLPRGVAKLSLAGSTSPSLTTRIHEIED